MRRFGSKPTWFAGASVVVLAAVVGAGGAGAQAAPTLSVSPTRATTGTTVTFTYTGAPCDDPAFQTIDSVRQVVDVEGTEVSPGTWTFTTTDPGADVFGSATCGSERLDAFYDSDVPEFAPFSVAPPLVDFRGTECDRPSARVVLTRTDGTVDDFEVMVADDGTFTVQAVYPQLIARVEATCGDLVYDPVVWGDVVPSTTTSTTTTAPTGTPTPLPDAVPAPAADPIRGTSTYTG